jgi:hypothetical protein
LPTRMSDSTHHDIERAEALLRPLMPGIFRVSYLPDMPRRDRTPARWFQVVFAVGPGDAPTLRTQVHALFPAMLAALSGLPLATDADIISLRARRHCPESSIYNPEHPFMFIEADWTGSTFRTMRQRSDFSTWGSECLSYRNHFDRDDPFTRQYAGQLIA